MVSSVFLETGSLERKRWILTGILACGVDAWLMCTKTKRESTIMALGREVCVIVYFTSIQME